MGVSLSCCTTAAESEPEREHSVDISDFEIGRTIGKGSFGNVCIVTHKKANVDYALKYINKSSCAAKGLATNIINERRILEHAKSAFICNLRYAFQDDVNLLMVIDLNVGGDLGVHLRLCGGFGEERAKFYAAEISCGLAYLHAMNIVHRDIKPGNILMNSMGHVSITDFNLACYFKEDLPLTSTCGTLRYMAPEIFEETGYWNDVDWWSLGIMTYEMLTGNVPFDKPTDRETIKAIRLDTPKLPETSSETLEESLSEDCRSLLAALLTKDPHKRLGSKEAGYHTEMMSHPWWKMLDWAKVMQQQLQAPFIPDTRRSSYYTKVYNLDEVMFDESPLETRPVRSKSRRGSSNVSRGTSRLTTPQVTEYEIECQLMMFQTSFLDYDHTKPSTKPQRFSLFPPGNSDLVSVPSLHSVGTQLSNGSVHSKNPSLPRNLKHDSSKMVSPTASLQRGTGSGGITPHSRSISKKDALTDAGMAKGKQKLTVNTSLALNSFGSVQGAADS